MPTELKMNGKTESAKESPPQQHIKRSSPDPQAHQEIEHATPLSDVREINKGKKISELSESVQRRTSKVAGR